MQQQFIHVPLSRLIPGRSNPRRVKPARDAHRRMVASVRSHDLILPLVVQPAEKPKHYVVIIGKRRFNALRELHGSNGKDVKVPCIVRKVEHKQAAKLALAENFVREPMHPLDEAEAFARLAAEDGKGAPEIVAEFGVEERYVRQRMKLATLHPQVKAAYRAGAIDTGTAEAFAAVPRERQLEVWAETGGHPRHADHVRNLIAHDWIDAGHALFDVATLPEGAVSGDLFNDRVLVERKAFMEAQLAALAAQRETLVEEGWAEAVVGSRGDVTDRLLAMDVPEREFDLRTARKLAKLATRREKLESKLAEVEEGDESAVDAVQRRYEALEVAEQEIIKETPAFHSEETKAIATAFLIIGPDGKVRREVRVPRQKHRRGTAGVNGDGVEGQAGEPPKPPTSDDLSKSQLADTFTHEALAVREALLSNDTARKRLLALILHDKVNSEALSVGHEPNGTTLHAATGEGFSSPVFDRLSERRAKLDPFKDDHHVAAPEGYERLSKLTPKKLDALIDVLIVDCLTAHMARRTELVHGLATELQVDLRANWRPDAAWLSGFRKCQLTHLLAELRGPTYSPAHDERKKSELVEAVATLFADAADGKLEDKQAAERVNRWIPSNLREVPPSDA